MLSPSIGWNPIIAVPSACMRALILGARVWSSVCTSTGSVGMTAGDSSSGRWWGGTQANTTFVKVPATGTKAPSEAAILDRVWSAIATA